jgi:hypothetical protein
MAEQKIRRVRQTIQPSTYIRTLKQVEHACPVCGKKFWGTARAKYCGHTCSLKANYERHAEKYRKARMERYYEDKK